MKKYIYNLVIISDRSKNLGLLILRIGIGIIFMFHGYPKLTAGPEMWTWLGNQMSYLGITFWPAFWGCIAACTEFFGGLFLILGFYTRIASFFMACMMFVATVMHVSKGDGFKIFSHPLSMLIVFIALFIAGSGRYSIDRYIIKKYF